METTGKRFRYRSGLVVLFFLMFTHFLSAVEVEWKDHIIENQRFTLKFITTYGGRQSVEIEDPIWPEGISKVSGPYTAQKTVQNEDGSHATILQVIYTLRGNHPGIFEIPPIIVSDGLSEQKSEFQHIPILSKDEGFLSYPLLLDWGEVPETLYKGQAVPLILMMENMEEISLPDSVAINTPDTAFLEQVRGLGDIRYSSLGENTLYHVPMQTWMLTPSKAGDLTLDSVQVKILGLTRYSEKKTIKVIPLPEEVSSTGGAVGSFQYSLELPKNNTTVNEALSLTIGLEGVGNLNYLELPKPLFPDSVTVIEKDNSEYLAMEGGFEGRRELQYIITAKEEGNFNIHIPPFSWLDPVTGNVSYSPSRDINIDVLSLLDTLNKDDTLYSLLPAEELLQGKIISLYKTPVAYLLLFPGGLVLVLSRFRKIRKIRKSLILGSLLFTVLFLSASLPEEDNQNWITDAENYFESKDYESALILYTRAARDWQDNWVFQYNKGVLHFLNKEDAQAVASLRKALYMSNNSNQVRSTLKSLEVNIGLENQIDLTLLLSPNLIFLLFVLSVNLLLFTVTWLLVKNTSLPVLFLLFFSITVLGTGAELTRTVWLLNRNEAVILQDVAIRKIPEVGGSSWITVQEGTSVELISEYDNFTLIRSAYGLEGWVLKKDLIPVNGGPAGEI